jgi:hypothetical protein
MQVTPLTGLVAIEGEPLEVSDNLPPPVKVGLFWAQVAGAIPMSASTATRHSVYLLAHREEKASKRLNP